METKQRIDTLMRNADPITKEPGLHLVGTGLGAAAGGVAGIGAVIATGAVLGSVVGPVGTAMGVSVGIVAGALIGKGLAEQIHPTVEEKVCHEWYPDKTVDDVELDLERQRVVVAFPLTAHPTDRYLATGSEFVDHQAESAPSCR